MYFEGRIPNYDKYPTICIKGHKGKSWQGYESIVQEIKRRITKENTILVIDVYYGADMNAIYDHIITPLNPATVIDSAEAVYSEDVLYEILKRNITEDRVFGSFSTHTLEDCMDPKILADLKEKARGTKGLVIVYGVGASMITKGNLHLYIDMKRWEIQLRYRNGLPNWGASNAVDDILRKFKRGYFVEWRILDRHKFKVLPQCDYILDLNVTEQPKMTTIEVFNDVMKEFSSRPFRLVPYFDEGIWGGRWMEEVCDLKRIKFNYAWCFDGVPEENSIRANVDGVTLEFPAMDLVKMKPKALLGPKVFARFGAEFPIRFDFLDTMTGGNLSLQVHPLTEYIHENFGMSYTQDESYYILDAGPNAHVYLGVKDGVTAETLVPALQRANEGKEPFRDSEFINSFPIQKHDHILIPAGTVHCSGSDAMVLEISATPYIFTFKMWDWGRVGLDGKPRPVNIERAVQNIQFDRTTQWCKDNLVSNIQEIENTKHLKVEKTGLHELEFIETKRYWFDQKTMFTCEESVNMCNLIEGEEALITSVDESFEPFEVHYAETFIIPERVHAYQIEPYGRSLGKEIAIIKATVRV